MMETIAARFGSRFCLNFRPKDQVVGHSSLGKYYDAPLDFALGIDCEGDTAAFPFTKKHKYFTGVEQGFTMTRLTFKGIAADALAKLVLDVISPFYPQDERLTLNPTFILKIGVSKYPGEFKIEFPAEGNVFLDMVREGATIEESGRRVTIRYTCQGLPVEEVIEVVEGECKLGGKHLLEVPYVAESIEKVTPICTLLWSSYVSAPVLQTKYGLARFKYTEFFPNAAAALEETKQNLAPILAKCAWFDNLFEESSLGRVKIQFLAYAFHSFALNAWWMATAEGKDWFSVWEGNCKFHSTIDVEYNDGLLYFALWPQLAEMLVQEWPLFEKQNTQGLSFLAHDMGQNLDATKQYYPHAMEVEENTNFLLFLYAIWKQTGHAALVKDRVDLLDRLVGHLVGVDTTGNGFPDLGCANTIDDASPAIQYAREQTYLAIKMFCSFEVVEEMATFAGHTALAAKCATQAALVKKTLDAQAWAGDHYIVTIDKRADDLKKLYEHVYTPVEYDVVQEGTLPGWDSYTLYISNGMLYPLMGGKVPGLDLARIKQDLSNSARKSLGEFCCWHSSDDHSHGWISQNLWRDFIGMYLGIYLDYFDRYWAFQVAVNQEGPGRLFTDTVLMPHLHYYPRGTTAFGIFFALPGLSIDRVAGNVRINPAAMGPFRLPLLALANWQNQQVPWVEAWISEGRLLHAISGMDTFKDLELKQ